MNEIQFYSQMAIPVAEQRSSTREPIQLASFGGVLRMLSADIRQTVNRFEQAVAASTRQVTYCNYNPRACQNVL